MEIKLNRAAWKFVSLYGFGHFLVDFVCAFLVFGLLFIKEVEIGTFITLAILYNLLAFGLQVPFGVIADKYKIPKLLSGLV